MVIQGATGTPSRHLEVQLYIFIDFGSHSWSLAFFCGFSVILGSKMGDSFQVHVFSDPGMEMMPECSGCMCLNHNKKRGFREIPLVQLIHEFGVPREGFRCHFGVRWWPWGHFFSFVRVLGEA